MPNEWSPRRVVAVAAALIGAAALMATAAPASDPSERALTVKSKRTKVNDGTWTGTAVDDKYGSVGTIRFNVRDGGRRVRHLRVVDVAGDCTLGGGPTSPTLNIPLPRAKIRPTGLMRGHYVFGDPGDAIMSVVSYSARFDRRTVTNGRIYQNNDINNATGGTCEVPSVTFTAARQGG